MNAYKASRCIYREVYKAYRREARRYGHKESYKRQNEEHTLDMAEDEEAAMRIRGHLRPLRYTHHHRLAAERREDAMLADLLAHHRHVPPPPTQQTSIVFTAFENLTVLDDVTRVILFSPTIGKVTTKTSNEPAYPLASAV